MFFNPDPSDVTTNKKKKERAKGPASFQQDQPTDCLCVFQQGGTASDPISAIPAAIKTKTSLLLGLWASGGDTSFANELNALKAAIAAHGSDLGGLVDGISVGSEDLYRNSPQGIQAGSNVGAEPDTIARYIQETRDAIAGTPLEGSPVGHVDTWTAWYNGSNQAVIDACDWLGMDAYPYFQDTMANAIGQSGALFSDALAKTTQAGGGSKAVWITETGHPVSGDTVGQSVASVENAETYWKDVGCPLFDTTNVWWYTLQDASPDTPSPSFGIVGSDLSTTPLFDLSCDDAPASASSAIASATAATSKVSSGTQVGAIETGSSGSGSGSGSSDDATATETASQGGDSGGSPTGIASSQASLEESATVAPSVSASTFYPGATGSAGVIPVPGNNGTYVTSAAPPAASGGSGSGSGSGSGAGSAASPSTTSPSVDTGAANSLQSKGAFSAAFLAVIGAVLAL